MRDKNDLTEGNVLKKMLGFYFPMLFTNLFQQIYSVADTAIVGKGLGDNALGAVGNFSSLSFLIIGFVTGITGGFAVIIAQSFGSGESENLRKSISSSIKLSLEMTIILSVVGCLLLEPLLLMIQTDKALLGDGLRYGYIIFAGLFATVAFNLCTGILRSFGDSRTPFIAIVISSVVNIALDYVLIFLFHTGVEGAAIATVFSQGLSAFICFTKLRQMRECLVSKGDFAEGKEMELLLLKNGIPMALMNSITSVGCMIVQRYVNGYGAGYTSAYAVCTRYLNLFMLPSLTAGFAVSAFVSQNYGAHKLKRIRQGVNVCLGIAVVSYVVLGFTMEIFPRHLAGFMLANTETIELVTQYFRVCGFALILLNLLFVYRGAVQGMGHPFVPMISGIAEMVIRIPIIILLLPGIGFKATGYADALAWITALFLNLSAYIYYMNIRQDKNNVGVP